MASSLRNPGRLLSLPFVVLGSILVLISACSLDGDDVEGYVSPYHTTPAADPDHDQSSAGVYRGVLVGSQGIFQIYIANEPGVYEAHLELDDSSCTLRTDYFDDNPGWEPGDQIVHAVFRGAFPDDGTTWAAETATVDFSVGPNGGITNDLVTVTVSGHSDPVHVLVSKEGSDRLVLQYVGRAYSETGNPWADWGFLVVCPQSSEEITVSGCMVQRANTENTWDIGTKAPEDGVTGIVCSENGEIAPIQGQTPAVDLTGVYGGVNSNIPNLKIHGEFDTARWPDRISGWWKSYFGTWGSDPLQLQEGTWDSERTPAPEAGGIRINISGQPSSFFEDRLCHYAICESGSDPSIPADRTAEGTVDLVGGYGVGDAENLSKGQYDVYVAVDVDSDGYAFSEGHPFDGDLHDFRLDVTVDSSTVDMVFTLKAVAGQVSWSPALGGDLYVALCTHVPPPPGFEIEQQVNYYGITGATSATYTVDATGLGDGQYYLLGVVATLTEWQRAGWYGGANAAEGTDIPPVDLSNLQDGYDFSLAPP
jgi:hypothetical protein